MKSLATPVTETAAVEAVRKVRGPVPEEDQIFDAIAAGIASKRIRPGTRLKEAVLAAEHGVSRARIRRVLRRLAELNVVQFQLNIGAIVARPSQAEAAAVFATRRILEAEAVRLVTQRADQAAFESLRLSVTAESQAFGERTPAALSLASQFHTLLGDASGNPILARILNQLVHQCVLIQALFERDQQHTICLIHEHDDIVQRMEAGDIAGAIAAMDHHIAHIEESLDLAGEP